jgi:hypothetical protein
VRLAINYSLGRGSQLSIYSLTVLDRDGTADGTRVLCTETRCHRTSDVLVLDYGVRGPIN